MGADVVAGDPAAVEAVLARCIERAREAGVAIVWGAFEVFAGEHEPERVIGCCAVGAHQWFAGDGESSALACAPIGEIAAGFDGCEIEYESDWYAVGARLRERYQPVPASSIDGAQ